MGVNGHSPVKRAHQRSAYLRYGVYSMILQVNADAMRTSDVRLQRPYWTRLRPNTETMEAGHGGGFRGYGGGLMGN